MKKIILSGLITAAAFAFPGMQGGMGGNAAMVGKPMKGLKDNTVVAKIDGKKVTVKDVNNFLQGMTADNRIRLQDLPAQHVGQFVKQYVDVMIIYKKAKSVEKNPQFKALMKKMAVDYWLKQKLNNMKIADAEVKKFYEENKDIYFKTTPKVKARHIVVKDEKIAKKLINELKNLSGKKLEQKFAQLAEKYSIGPSKIDGGELGYFKLSDMAPEFSNAVSSLKIGQITTKPVKTKYGYHVILLENTKSDVYVPFSKVKMQILYNLKSKKMNEILDNLQKRANVKILVK